MRKSLAKSIYFGAAALAFAGIVGTTSTTASAKSYATAGAYTALTTGKNVVATGSNAIYSKPGTVKGAKVVASKATVAKLAASKSSADTLYAYATKTTNKGSVYYKVVTMDKKYRGYIYGGKSTSTVAGGIKTTDTTTTATTPVRTTGYYLKNVSANTIWTAPKFTDINAKKVSLYGAAKTDPFTVDKAATKSKEGSLYYHVTDSKDSSISGWIYAGKGYDASATTQDLGGLSLTQSDATATSNNSVNVVYRDATTKKTVGTATWVTSTANTKAGDKVDQSATNAEKTELSDFVTKSAPSGYAAGTVDTSSATYGNTVYVDVTATATSKVSFRVVNVENNVSVSNPLTVNTKLSASDFNTNGLDVSAIKKQLTGDENTKVNDDQLGFALQKAVSDNLVGTKTYYTSDGSAYHYTFKFANGITGTYFYGDTVTADLTATLVSGSSASASSDTSWID